MYEHELARSTPQLTPPACAQNSGRLTCEVPGAPGEESLTPKLPESTAMEGSREKGRRRESLAQGTCPVIEEHESLCSGHRLALKKTEV